MCTTKCYVTKSQDLARLMNSSFAKKDIGRIQLTSESDHIPNKPNRSIVRKLYTYHVRSKAFADRVDRH